MSGASTRKQHVTPHLHREYVTHTHTHRHTHTHTPIVICTPERSSGVVAEANGLKKLKGRSMTSVNLILNLILNINRLNLIVLMISYIIAMPVQILSANKLSSGPPAWWRRRTPAASRRPPPGATCALLLFIVL